jgi:DNA mismatch repair protein MutL
MADIIQLLPDAIANQIAAGEVIQRPASVVKELMENAIDAGASDIRLVVKDAGKALLQVIDNGCGMSETDARMAFERHATSKIRQTNDLFSIRTMGFRGEALASIAAVAQVEIKTRRHSDELGTRLVIEGSELIKQEPCQCPRGTAFSVKNLFFNVPARRNFLKSNSVEMRHIVDEFQRIAIAHSDSFFALHHNDNEVFHLPPGKLRQRLLGLFGKNANKKLVPVEEETEVLRLRGYVGKPEFAKKTRGEQFFFVNDRFIKSPYLNHAIVSAYEDLLPSGTYPLYVMFINIDPRRIDVNVHPTKQEIKFDDERLVYNYLRVAVRHALGQHSITPTLDFDQDPTFSGNRIQPRAQREETVSSTGTQARGTDKADAISEQQRRARNLKNWEELYEGLEEFDQTEAASDDMTDPAPHQPLTLESDWHGDQQAAGGAAAARESSKAPNQLHNRYIVSQIKSGILLLDQQAAHERILYEKYLYVLRQQQNSTQQQLFPRTLSLSPADAALLKELQDQINLLGFDIEEFGANTFVINGVPAELAGKQDEQVVIESLLEQYKGNLEFQLEITDNLARAMARSASIKKGQPLTADEMQSLIDQLFACEVPYKSPSGRKCFISLELEELSKRFDY